ncbi:hypothetical protein AOQ84DRAFT_357071 [Glonium stellatum]|uniref:Uncharacterized protein n=1 Tax=Glonium stellatum TaxID=574774 RepID=A0A8E2JMR2_9PEZI|nr:hypothetical protein AOQ84DRAFT_357071 [Glonium stellatum]
MHSIYLSVSTLLICFCTTYAAFIGTDHAAINQKRHDHSNHTHAGLAHMHHNQTTLDRECAKIRELTALTDLVNNATKLQELETKDHLSAAQVAELKDKASNATTKLTTLKANSTLVADCAVVDAKLRLEEQCAHIARLTALTDLVNNATKLSELETKKNLTAEEIAKLKEKAANATVRLTEMEKNTTLVDSCASLKASRSYSTATFTAAVAAVATGNGAVLGVARNSVATITGSVMLAILFAVLL